jgi:hypothetical protein
MTPEVLWTEIHERFDPWAPPARPKWRIDRTDKGLYKVHVRLNRPFEKRCKVLVAGTKGAGKTAELLKLAEDRAERDQTFFFDLYQHLQNVIQDPSAINELQPWEVCALIGLAVHRGMASRFPTLWPAEPVERLSEAWTRLIPATSNTPVLSIGKLAETLAVLVSTAVDGGASIALATAGKLAGGVRWDRKLGRHERTSDQDPRVEALVESVHHVLEKAAEVSGKRLLFVLDGLDQIRNSQPATRLFIDSALLSNLPTVLVATAPYSMRFDQSLHGARGFEKHYVMNEPVLNKKAPDDPQAARPGAAVLRRAGGGSHRGARRHHGRRRAAPPRLELRRQPPRLHEARARCRRVGFRSWASAHRTRRGRGGHRRLAAHPRRGALAPGHRHPARRPGAPRGAAEG